MAIIDDTEQKTVTIAGTAFNEKLLEYFDGWLGAQYWHGSEGPLQTFQIGTTVQLGVAPPEELTKIKVRVYADQPSIVGPVYMYIYEGTPLTELTLLGEATPIQTIPGKGFHWGEWIEGTFPSGIYLFPGIDYSLFYYAPNSWWDLNNQNRLMANTCWDNTYLSGNLWGYDIDAGEFHYWNRDIAFQIYGTVVE